MIPVYICNEAYFYTENDGNGDVKLHVPFGMIIHCMHLDDLPGNMLRTFDSHWTEAEIEGQKI